MAGGAELEQLTHELEGMTGGECTRVSLLETLTVGRISVNLYAEELHASFAEARHFVKSIGGSPTNVAVALARLGRRAAVFTKVGDDALGDYARTALAEEFGVDTRFVGTHPTLQRRSSSPRWTRRRTRVRLLPAAARARLHDHGRGGGPRARRRRAHPLGERRRARRRALAGDDPRTPRAAGTPAPHDPRPRLPPVVLGERRRSRAARSARPSAS